MLDKEQYRILILTHNADLRARFGNQSNWALGGDTIGIMPSQAGRSDPRLLTAVHGAMDQSRYLRPSEVNSTPIGLARANGAHPSYGVTATHQVTQQLRDVMDPSSRVVRFMPPAPLNLNEMKLAGALQSPAVWGTEPGDIFGPSNRSWYTKRPVGALGMGMYGGKNSYMTHVKAYRAKHPHLTQQQAMKAASASYH